jgi:hypothetical protein
MTKNGQPMRSLLLAGDGDGERVSVLIFGDGAHEVEVGDRLAVEGKAEASIYAKTGEAPIAQLGIVASWWRPIGKAAARIRKAMKASAAAGTAAKPPQPAVGERSAAGGYREPPPGAASLYGRCAGIGAASG